jgi:hypothetical protein
MIQTSILGFLVGAVISWGFRIWAVIPITLAIFAGMACYDIYQGERVLSAIGAGLFCALAPQTGYAFGLVIRGVLVALRASKKSHLNTSPLETR